MNFKRHKPSTEKDLDRWSLPKRVKLDYVPDTVRPAKKRKRSGLLCPKTKKPHQFTFIEQRLVHWVKNFVIVRNRCADCKRIKYTEYKKVDDSESSNGRT